MVPLRMPPAQIFFQRLARHRPGLHIAMSHRLYHDIHSLSNIPDRSDSSLVEALQFVTSTVSKQSPTPYTGTAGTAYALWRAGSLLSRPDLSVQAQDLAAAALRRSAHVVDESLLDGRCWPLQCELSAVTEYHSHANGAPQQKHKGLLNALQTACHSSMCRYTAPSSSSCCMLAVHAGRAGVLLVNCLVADSIRYGPAVQCVKALPPPQATPQAHMPQPVLPIQTMRMKCDHTVTAEGCSSSPRQLLRWTPLCKAPHGCGGTIQHTDSTHAVTWCSNNAACPFQQHPAAAVTARGHAHLSLTPA